jgi:hypothetical protein
LLFLTACCCLPCICNRGKLPQFSAYEEQLPAAAGDVTTAAAGTSGTEQQEQQELTNITTSDPTAGLQQGAQPPSQQQQQHPQHIQQQGSQQQQQQQQPADNGLPVLIGITNLYFIKMLPQWPNVVSVSKKEAVSRWGCCGSPFSTCSNKLQRYDFDSAPVCLVTCPFCCH